MSPHARNRFAIVALFLAAVALCAVMIWRYGYDQALAQVEKQGRADLALASDRFTGELRRYQVLTVLMADHPTLSALTDGGARQAAQQLLRETADKSGALGLFYADATGQVLAHAGSVTLVPAGSAYFARAMQGALGTFYGRLGPDGRRAYAYAAPTFDAAGAVRGSLIVLADIAELEWDWIGGRLPVFFTDPEGRVFVSNRSELLDWQTREDGPGLRPRDGPVPDFRARTLSAREIWTMDWGGYLPKSALHLTREAPVIGMTGHALVDVAPARRVAGLQTLVFTVICLAFGAVVLQLAERRRTLARANAQLESRVAERTVELSGTNAALRREVTERMDAEAALKRAQDELVQAGKLSALGQMSAGISHELNQPLMAIQQFADNGAAFLERDKPEKAGENLSRISQLAARAARIIKNLRAFARNESEPTHKVDLVQVIDSAIELTQGRLDGDGITLDWPRPAGPIFALGGEVRLAQVFVNLINNAADAMSGQNDGRIIIEVTPAPRLSVTVRDTGPGITDPNQMFEPFYSTKEVGSDDGMGLGLSISYGLVQSFGGNIHGANAEDRGAVFTVELEPWTEEAAA